MAKYCKSIDEFVFDEFEQKMRPCKDDAEMKLMDYFRANACSFLKAARMAYHDKNGQLDHGAPIVESFYDALAGYLDVVPEPDEELFKKGTPEFYKSIVLTLVAMEYIRTDLPNSFLEDIDGLGFGIVEDYLRDTDQYETWEYDRSITIKDVERYLCELLPPEQGEMYLYDKRKVFDYDVAYTEYQIDLLKAAKENIKRLDYDNFDDGGPIFRFITAK